jgi:hypothetical protein
MSETHESRTLQLRNIAWLDRSELIQISTVAAGRQYLQGSIGNDDHWATS